MPPPVKHCVPPAGSDRIPTVGAGQVLVQSESLPACHGYTSCRRPGLASRGGRGGHARSGQGPCRPEFQERRPMTTASVSEFN